MSKICLEPGHNQQSITPDEAANSTPANDTNLNGTSASGTPSSSPISVPIPVQTNPLPTEKNWYDSKTLWVNTLLLLAMITQQVTGKDILTPEIQAAVIALINVILRMVTKDKITWK